MEQEACGRVQAKERSGWGGPIRKLVTTTYSLASGRAEMPGGRIRGESGTVGEIERRRTNRGAKYREIIEDGDMPKAAMEEDSVTFYHNREVVYIR